MVLHDTFIVTKVAPVIFNLMYKKLTNKLFRLEIK